MENYIVSARKYRPSTFDTVIGQHAITSTLKNAIKNNHLAQSFLFCGPRGVGKTSCARILAKTINCFHPTENIEACDECESCQSFNSGQSLNVYELDAASNNSVEDIRNLIDQVRFAPQLGTHKVYIIDEVHMLSQQAFNAFLKTLEEPPKHAIFILATTEKHKIIPTILSRCQIFDFNRISVDDIANHLKNIAQKEGVSAEPEALHLIAQKADGALRDALSIFDQIVSYSENKITYKNVIDNLNVLDYDYYFKMCDYILEKDPAQILLLFNTILSKGFDGHQFINGLAAHIRNLLVCKNRASIVLLEVSNSIKEKYQSYASKFEAQDLLDMLQILSNADTNYKSSKNQRLLVEITLLQLASVLNKNEKKNPSDEITPLIAVQKDNTQTNGQSVETKNNSSQNNETSTQKENSPTNNSYIKSNSKNSKDETDNTIHPKTPLQFNKLNIVTKSIKLKDHNEEQSTDGKKTNVSFEPKENKPFSKEAFEQAWKEYQHILEQEGKKNLALVFDVIPPFNEEYTFTLPVRNKALEEEFKEDKHNLMEFLRKKLKNHSISVLTYVNKPEDDNTLPYTPQEKLDKIKTQYPAVAKMVDKFKLKPKI